LEAHNTLVECHSPLEVATPHILVTMDWGIQGFGIPVTLQIVLMDEYFVKLAGSCELVDS
jgi:hypothetical protein